jgi:hypothetical protein
LVSAFFLSCLGFPRGIIEGEGFRMVRNGQSLWELMPDEKGGIKITFTPGGKQVCEMGFFDKAVACNCKVGETVSHLVVSEDVYGNSVSVDNGKAPDEPGHKVREEGRAV